jgi:hypothetical protein
MADVSAIGSEFLLRASETFPEGFTIDAFATDADPFTFADREIASMELDINGNPVTRALLAPIEITFNLTPGTPAAENMAVLFEANAAGRGKIVNRDEITLSQSMPSGHTATLKEGIITSGPGGFGSSADGRVASQAYTLMFASMTTTRPRR